MSHVDEGLLTAYLDGAFEAGSAERREIETHLAACADCRVLLDDARRTKNRAQRVLDAAVPGAIAAPPWEDVVAEHGRRSGEARPRRRSFPLAWAASLVLAVGAGWMARSLTVTEPFGSEMLEQEALPPAVSEADAISTRDATAGVDVRTLDDATERREEIRAAAPEPQRRPGAAASAPPPPVEQERQADVAQKAAAPAAVPAESVLARNRVGLVDSAAARTRTLDEVAVTGLAAPSAAFRTATDPLRAALAERLAGAVEAWAPVSTEAFAGTADPPASFDGLEAVSVEQASADDRSYLRARYVVDGDTVDVLQVRSVPADADAGRRDRRGREDDANEARVRTVLEVRGWTVVLSGPPDAVSRLAERVR